MDNYHDRYRERENLMRYVPLISGILAEIAFVSLWLAGIWTSGNDPLSQRLEYSGIVAMLVGAVLIFVGVVVLTEYYHEDENRDRH